MKYYKNEYLNMKIFLGKIFYRFKEFSFNLFMRVLKKIKINIDQILLSNNYKCEIIMF